MSEDKTIPNLMGQDGRKGSSHEVVLESISPSLLPSSSYFLLLNAILQVERVNGR
jgi:hypothetical protein